jgi:hypothetical protein
VTPMATATEAAEAVAGGRRAATSPARPVTLALARIEGRRLLRSPALAVGLAVGALQILPGALWPEAADLRLRAMDAGFLVLPLAAATLIAASLATLRARRHGTEELLSATPAPPQARTAAHLLAPLGMALVAVAVVAAALLAAWRFRHGFARPDLAEAAVGPLLVLGAGALGVLLARWLRSSIAAVVACVGIAVMELYVSGLGQTNPLRRLAFWSQSADMRAELLPGRLARWHLVYLVGLVAMAAVGALARHGLSRKLTVAGVLAITLVATSAWFQARPIPPSAWASRNALLERPHDFQQCQERDGVRYCAYPAYRSLIELWAAPVAGVRRALPPGRWPGDVQVTQRVTGNDRFWVTSPDVQRKLPALPPTGGPTVDDGDLHPPMLWDTTGRAELGLAVMAASRAVGLPLAQRAPDIRCHASGQARAVVALWLAGQATPATARTLRQLTREAIADIGGRLFLVIPDYGTPGAVAFGATEAALALELLSRPASSVATAVGASWDELTASDAPSVAAASLLGLNDPGPAPFRGHSDLRGFSSFNGQPLPTIGEACP